MKSTAIIFAISICMSSRDVFITADDIIINEGGDETQAPLTSLSTHLTSYKEVPMIGINIGSQHDGNDKTTIPQITSQSIGKPTAHGKYQLIDTTHETDFQTLGNSLQQADYHPSNDNEEDNIHITAKVPYTHLGYDRTKLFVSQYLSTSNNLPPNAKIHLILHYPRCTSLHDVRYCQKEEKSLPPAVKEAGPSPLLDNNMFLDSWRALEELYISVRNVGSIGVAYFEKGDLDVLVNHCKIIPHVYQGSVKHFFRENREVFDLLMDNRILFQVMDVDDAVIRPLKTLPNLTVKFLEWMVDTNYGDVTIDTLIVAWFVQNRLGVILPRSIGVSPSKVGMVRLMTHEQGAMVGDLIHAALSVQDVEKDAEHGKVVVTISNKRDQELALFWVNGDSKEEHHVGFINAEREISITSLPGHEFKVKKGDESIMAFGVDAGRGEQQFVTIT